MLPEMEQTQSRVNTQHVSNGYMKKMKHDIEAADVDNSPKLNG